MADTYEKATANIAPAPTGAAGSNDVTSGMQPATVNGTIGDVSGAATLPGQSIGIASSADFHEKQ